jgi:hypothetical protein
MAEDKIFAAQSDDHLVRNAFTRGGGEAVEMMRRLKDTLEAEMRAANALSAKIHGLNQALLWYTIAIAIMAAFQFGAWIKDLTR